MSFDQSLYFTHHPRLPFWKNLDGFAYCYILYTALSVENSRLSEGLQALLFQGGPVRSDQIRLKQFCSWRRASSGHVLMNWVLGGVCFLRGV